MRNPSLHNSAKGFTHDCTSILDSIAKGTSCFQYLAWCITTLPFIQLNACNIVQTPIHVNESFSILLLWLHDYFVGRNQLGLQKPIALIHYSNSDN